jgi:sugar phosphate isomerase/epimerase
MKDTTLTTSESSKSISRRRFLRTAAAVAAAYAIIPASSIGRPASRRLSIEGVQVGAITYSFRALPSSAKELLGYLKQSGMDTTELMGGPAEEYAGGPQPPSWQRVGTQMTEEQRAEFAAAREEYNKKASEWRMSAPMNKFKELGEMYRDNGVTVDILKLGDARWSDEEIDYAFRAAKAIGARGISFEISNEAAERMGPFATKHELMIGMHNHTKVGEEGFSFDIPLATSKYSMLNLDIGHYVAGTNESPIPVIQKYHDRISHLHLKDRKKGENGGENVPWGEGDTPITEVLQLLQKEQYPITAMIELEYDIPEGSDVLTEMKKCVDYCRQSLS